VVGDFNGDGIPDAIATGKSGIWLFTGRGGGAFNGGVLIPITESQPPQSQPYWGPLAAADFNGDGNLDVAVTTNPNGMPAYGLYVLFGNGNGTFQAPVLIANNISSPNFVAAATTRDGYTDIVDPAGSIYLNNGKGSFAGPVEVAISGPAIAVGDVNGDGIPDLASSSGCVAYGEGETKFTAQRCYPVASTGSSRNVTLAELTKGKPGFNDIIAGEGGLVSVLLNEGNGAFVDGVWTSVPGANNCGAAGAFDGADSVDLVVPTSNGLTVLLGTGKAATPFTTGTTISLSGPVVLLPRM
jgi:hypothetical protein